MRSKKLAVLCSCAIVGAGSMFFTESVLASNVPVVAEMTAETKGTAGEYTLPVSGGDIAAALKAALKQGYSTIVIPAGNYTMSSQVEITSNLTIKAEGATITATGSQATILFTASGNSYSNITISGGTWNGGNKTSSAALRFYNTQGLTLNDCTLTQSAGAGLILNNCKNVTLANVKLDNNGQYGLNMNGGSIATVKISQANNNGKSGFFAQASSTMNMTSCTASSNKEKGIYYSASTGTLDSCTTNSNTDNGVAAANSKITVTNVKSEENRELGFSLTGTSEASVSGATITKNKDHGIQVTDSSRLTLTNTAGAVVVTRNDSCGVSASDKAVLSITGGSFDNNGVNPRGTDEGQLGHGIGVYNGAKATISGITCTGNKVCGISPFGKGAQVTVKDSTISNNGRHGIGAREQVKVTVENCAINGNKMHGIMDNDKSEVKVKDTTICNNNQNGLCVGKSSKATIENVTADSNKYEGLYVYEKSTLTVKGGSSSYNKKSGVTTNDNAQLTISGVKVYGNSVYGFNIKGGKANIQKCTIEKNKKSGVQVKKSDAKKGKKEAAKVSNLSNNTIKSNGQYGVYVNASTVTKMQKNTISGHKKYGIALYKKSTAKNIKSNKLNNPKGKEVYVEKGSKSNLSTVPAIDIKGTKKGAKKVTGKTCSKASVTIKTSLSSKKYKGKANKSGKFDIKTAKLKKGTKVTVTAKDSSKNTYTNTFTIK